MDEATKKTLAGSAGWFLWIALCTIINIVLYSTNSDTRLALSADSVEVAAVLFNQFGGGTHEFKMIVTYIIGIIGAGIYFLLTKPASEGKIWAFIVGFILYGLDAILPLMMTQWVGLAIHAWALYSMFGGIMACANMGKNAAAAQAAAAPAPESAAPAPESAAAAPAEPAPVPEATQSPEFNQGSQSNN